MAIKANIFGNLKRMQLSNTLPDNVEENGRLLTELLSSIASHCPNLNDIDLSENNLGVPGASAIGEAFVRLAANRKKLELNLSETNLDSEAAKTLSDKVLASLEDVSNLLSCEIELSIDNNPLGHSGLSAIFRMLSNENCPVTEIDLNHTHAVNQGLITATDFGEIETPTFRGRCSKLKRLYFRNNKPSGDTHVACLTMAIKANIFGNLEWLQLSNALPDNVEENGRLLTELLPSIASHCPNLNDLDLSENNLGVPGASAIGEAFVRLATNRKKLEVNLSKTNLESEAATVFSDKVLSSLGIVSNPLSCEINLRIDNNPLGHGGLLAIFRMLSNENCPVTRLHLDHTHAVNQGLITATDFKTLIFPGQCSKLKRLSFQNNKPSGNTHVACLTMVIKANIFGNLEWLQLSNTLPDNVEENGKLLTELLPSIASHCPHLNDIDLSENNLGVPGASAIGEAFVRLATNRTELKLNLRKTSLDSEAVKAFSDNVLASLGNMSNPLSCEINLRIDNNPLGHSGLSAIF
ncbi:NACHT, LRR and PYD domains-containing protein 3-like [Halichondria panicea]|uniref:NACHT, LRR and PYD domains-containing protein 3-like n=1 Tax=Halichondria panicea TaxID=6063 RepID=UPI00312B32D5